MEQAHVSMAASSIVRICCDRFEEQDWSGRFYTMYREEPASFLNTRELLEGLDGFYNWLGYPQTSMAERNFLEPLEEKASSSLAFGRKKKTRQKGEEIVVGRDEMNRHQGGKATFVVRIQYRQNASWQGQITWAEKNKTVSFRSALELLKLIDSTESSAEENWDRGDEQE